MQPWSISKDRSTSHCCHIGPSRSTKSAPCATTKAGAIASDEPSILPTMINFFLFGAMGGSIFGMVRVAIANADAKVASSGSATQASSAPARSATWRWASAQHCSTCTAAGLPTSNYRGQSRFQSPNCPIGCRMPGYLEHPHRRGYPHGNPNPNSNCWCRVLFRYKANSGECSPGRDVS